ncbi:ribonuclease HII [Desulfarculales bacterium]
MASSPRRGRGGLTSQTEDNLRVQGYALVAGVDEVGRGPLAGPVVAAAVILPVGWDNPGVDDSKRLTAPVRESLAAQVRATALTWGLGLVEPSEIDYLNIHRASLLAMARAVEALTRLPDFLLVDGRFTLGMELPQRAVVGGDGAIASIAAASILAKVHRDGLMLGWHQRWPVYNFAANKGYGTAEHLLALREHGPCPLHRMSFAPMVQQELGLALGGDRPGAAQPSRWPARTWRSRG